jgi:hypothetical protein
MIEPPAKSPRAAAFFDFDETLAGTSRHGAADIDRRRRTGNAAINRMAFHAGELDGVYRSPRKEKAR